MADVHDFSECDCCDQFVLKSGLYPVRVNNRERKVCSKRCEFDLLKEGAHSIGKLMDIHA